MNGARHALNDHSFREPVILVAGVGLIDARIVSFPVGEFVGGDVEDAWRFAAFPKRLQGVRCQVA